MSHQEHRREAPQSVGCAVLIISDSRTEQTDESGKLLKEKLSQNGHRIIDYSILKNDAEAIKKKITELLGQDGLQVIRPSSWTGS
jgi:molybdenum cofactor biosynthesis protein B